MNVVESPTHILIWTPSLRIDPRLTDRRRSDTERSDDTVLVILDPLAITDEHLFRWGDPPHTYKIKAIDGLIQDEEMGVRFSSEVTVIR